MSIETVGEVAVITFGIVGAVVVGHKVQQAVEQRGASRGDQLIAGTVASGLVAAIPPVAVATGVVATCVGAKHLWTQRDGLSELRAKFGGFMDAQKRRASELYVSVKDRA